MDDSTAMEVEVKVIRCTICGTTKLNPVVLTEAQEAARQNVPDVLPYVACSRCGLRQGFAEPTYRARDKSHIRGPTHRLGRRRDPWLTQFRPMHSGM